MSDFIPEEILVQIFKRVPPKSLVRFRCVSKSWNSLVSSSYFVTLQNEWARASSRSILTGHFSRMQLYSIRRKNEVFSVENEVKKAFPFEYKRYNKSFRIIGSCNGLICLCYDESEFETQFILWNPSIGKRIALPLPRVTFENSVRSSEFGFGYDTESNDFKVVRLTGLKRESEEDDFPPIVEVFSLSRGKWREINPSPSQNWIVQFSRSFAFVNGKLHWLAYNLYNNVKKKVLGFDLTHEVFDEISLPELSGESIKEVAVDKDSLVLLAYGPLPSGISYDDKMYWGQQCSVWAMEEYGDGKSWTKMFRVHFEELLSLRKPSSKVLFGRVLGFTKKGDVVLVIRNGNYFSRRRNGTFVSYDPRTQVIRNLGVNTDYYSGRGTYGYVFVDTFIETLASIHERERFLGTSMRDRKKRKIEFNRAQDH